MARILGVGIATLDIINEVARYPSEDEEVRALSQRLARGGNCTNTLVVLSQLGHRCAWAGTLAEEPDADHIRRDLERHGVDLSPVAVLAGGKVPTSYVALSRDSGSRTIVHYRDLPEYPWAAFRALDLEGFDWLHFEGRAVEETAAMLADAAQRAPATPRSVEIEKPRADIKALYPHATLLLFSRVFARHQGFEEPEAFLRAMAAQAPQAVLACGWGEQGAYALDGRGRLWHSPAFPPPRVVDTLGAGDTLNGGIIHGRLRGLDWPQVLSGACRLAGRKCGQLGLDGLVGA